MGMNYGVRFFQPISDTVDRLRIDLSWDAFFGEEGHAVKPASLLTGKMSALKALNPHDHHLFQAPDIARHAMVFSERNRQSICTKDSELFEFDFSVHLTDL